MDASAYHVMPKEVKKYILIQNCILRYTCCINNTHWQIIGIIIFWCKQYIVVLDALVGSFSDVLFMLLAVILSGLDEKPRRKKDWVTKKITSKNFWEGHHCYDCTPSFLCHFLLLSLFTPSPFSCDVLAEWPL